MPFFNFDFQTKNANPNANQKGGTELCSKN
nr:MAG TPA: hypothetical protein [Caudoviricetes sp.]